MDRQAWTRDTVFVKNRGITGRSLTLQRRLGGRRGKDNRKQNTLALLIHPCNRAIALPDFDSFERSAVIVMYVVIDSSPPSTASANTTRIATYLTLSPCVAGRHLHILAYGSGGVEPNPKGQYCILGKYMQFFCSSMFGT